MPHEHPQGCCGAVQPLLCSLSQNRVMAAGVQQRDVVALTVQMPGSAETDGPGSNDGDGVGQLTAPAGITSE